MKLDVVDLDNGVAKAVLSGRLDIDGAAAIDLPFSALAGSKNKVIVDCPTFPSWHRWG